MSDVRETAKRLARERVPSRWLGAEMRAEYAANIDGLLVFFAGMPEPILITGLEILNATPLPEKQNHLPESAGGGKK